MNTTLQRWQRLLKHRRFELANDPGYKSLYTYTYDTEEDNWIHFFGLTYSKDPMYIGVRSIRLWRFAIELP